MKERNIMEIFVIIIGVIAVIILKALFETIRTKKDFNNSHFGMRVEILIDEYRQTNGEDPPNHLLPDIYRKARSELKKEGLI